MLTNSRTSAITAIKNAVKKIPAVVLDDELIIIVKTKHGNMIPMTTYQWLTNKHKHDYDVITFF